MNTMIQQNLVKKSIFDQHSESQPELRQFWQNWDEIEDIMTNEIIISEGYPQYKFRCFRLCLENENSLEEIELLIDHDLMCYASIGDRQDILGIVSLKRMKAELYPNICYNIRNNKRLKDCILLTHNTFLEILVFDDQSTFQELYEVLKSRCILNHFGEHYTIERFLDKGEFSKIVLASNKDDGMNYAVKHINKTKLSEKLGDDQFMQLVLLNEIHAMRYLDHQNIVKLHEVYESNNHLYLVMDLVEGEQLSKYLFRNKYLNEVKSRKLISQLVDTLEYLSQKQIIHRDIWLQNLLIDKQNKLYLIDFGFAEFTFDHRNVISKCGTPGYIAPEILKNQKQTQKVDVWSCGAILYNLLTGKSLFNLDSQTDLAEQNKLFQISNQFEHTNIVLSEEVVDLLKKMLDPNPNHRLSIEEVKNHEWLKGESFKQDNPIIKYQPNEKMDSLANISDLLQDNNYSFTDTTSIVDNSPILSPNIVGSTNQIVIQDLSQMLYGTDS